MSLLSVGLVGVGAQTQENLLPALLQIANVSITAVCDRIPERADLLRRHVRDVRQYQDVGTMLEESALDAIIVACPPQEHRKISLLAMERGINVFVEKPPCFTLSELTGLVEASKRRPVVNGVGMNFRFARAIRHLRRIQGDAAFGRATHIQLNHYANKPRAPMWGLESTLRSFLLAQAIHTIDLAVLFGGPIAEIREEVQHDNGAQIIEISITFQSGMTASILTGTMFPYFEFDMKLISDRSTMVQIDNLWNITLHEPGHATRAGGSDKRWRGYWRPGPLDSGYSRNGYQIELQEFFDAIRSGGRFTADFASLLPTYRVIEHVCNHAETAARPAAAAAAVDEEIIAPATAVNLSDAACLDVGANA
jgi:phthalate 4,5-cis-dihydrodiol dehydrogenase